VLEPGERKLYTLVQQLNTIRNAKARALSASLTDALDVTRAPCPHSLSRIRAFAPTVALQVKKRQEQQERRRKVFDKTRSKDDAASAVRLKEERKRRYMQEGKQDARKKSRASKDADD
jgi:hypothetical protein